MSRPLSVLLAACALILASSGGAVAAEPATALVKLPSGVTLHYAVQGRPGGPPLVLLHGIGDSWRSFELVLPHIPDRYRVYALSLRGHGYSDGPAAGYRQKDFAADVAAFLEALDLRGVTLVGHSLGSFVAQNVAVKDPGRIARLVLIGSGPGGVSTEPARTEMAAFFRGIPAPIPAAAARDFQASTAALPMSARFFETMVSELMRSAPQIWDEFAEDVHNAEIAEALRRVTIPVLLLWGEKDAMLGRAEQDALLARLPRARLVVLPGGGHAPHWETPERIAKEVLGFLDQHPIPTPPTPNGLPNSHDDPGVGRRESGLGELGVDVSSALVAAS